MIFTLVHRIVHVLDPELTAIARQLITKGDAILSRLDELKAANAAADAAIARIAEDVTHASEVATAEAAALRAQITALEAQIAAGFETTAEEQAELDALKAKLAGIDPDPSFPPVTPPEA